jgi:hypothetical protein
MAKRMRIVITICHSGARADASRLALGPTPPGGHPQWYEQLLLTASKLPCRAIGALRLQNRSKLDFYGRAWNSIWVEDFVGFGQVVCFALCAKFLWLLPWVLCCLLLSLITKHCLNSMVFLLLLSALF